MRILYTNEVRNEVSNGLNGIKFYASLMLNSRFGMQIFTHHYKSRLKEPIGELCPPVVMRVFNRLDLPI